MFTRVGVGLLRLLHPDTKPKKGNTMSKKKVTEGAAPEAQADPSAVTPVKAAAAKKPAAARKDDRDKRIAELEAKVRDGEEASLSRVCKAMGIDPSSIKAAEAAKAAKPKEAMISMFVHYPVNVNGTIYRGQVTVPYGTFQVISQALGDRRMRILRELTGNNYILQVGEVNAEGDRIG